MRVFVGINFEMYVHFFFAVGNVTKDTYRKPNALKSGRTLLHNTEDTLIRYDNSWIVWQVSW